MKTNKENTTDATLSVEAVKTAAVALKELLAKLAFIHPMAPAEREKLKAVGAMRVRQAERRVQVARQHPEVLPQGFDLSQFDSDLALSQGLLECLATVDKIRRGLSEALLPVGNRVTRSGVEAYGYIKAAAVSSTNLLAAASDLARYGPRRSKATATRPPAATATAAPGPTDGKPSTPEVKAA